MATIGTFNRTDDAYSGAIKTLSLNVQRRAARSGVGTSPRSIRPSVSVAQRRASSRLRKVLLI